MRYQKIAEDLRHQILSGALPAGTVVPTEAELCEQWGTSRGPVRNALSALRSEGLIDSQQGRQSRVLSRQARQAVDAYVPFTRWAQSFGRVPGAKTIELALRRAGESQAERLGVAPDSLVVELIRLRLLDGEPTMLERTIFREDIGRLLFDVDLDSGSITERLAERGKRFEGVVHEIDAVAADELDSQLLGLEIGAPVLRLQRRSTDAEGRPFEFSDDRYRSDIVRFTVDASGRQANGEHLIRPAAPA